MVSTTGKENGIQNVNAEGLPPGDYHVVGWDLDTTGRRLIDEICQIAAYSPADTFSQYVMPFRDLNPAARRRHNIRVVTVGRYRMLKDSKTGKVLKTKSEISALSDFIQWLETLKGSSVEGIILVSHEPRKVVAPLLLEALRKYNLLEKFCTIVKGFANGYAISEIKCAKTVRSFSLRTLSRVLLDKEEELDNAADRARLAFQVVQQLCAGEDRPQGSGDARDTTAQGLADAVRQFAQSITKEEEELAGLKMVLNRQNSLRPVFGPMLRMNRRDRQRASSLRRLLAEAEVDYATLTAAYEKGGKEGLIDLTTTKLPNAKPKEKEELLELLCNHFDPEKAKSDSKAQTNKENKTGAGDGADVSGSSTPDTATSSPVKAASSSGDTNTNNNSNATNSPQSNANSPKKNSTEPAVTSTPESAAS